MKKTLRKLSAAVTASLASLVAASAIATSSATAAPPLDSRGYDFTSGGGTLPPYWGAILVAGVAAAIGGMSAISRIRDRRRQGETAEVAVVRLRGDGSSDASRFDRKAA